jgi:AraC family transcriptional regulator, regulatory protein of adaptative response / DNA-3-methyladenine glycosylase II
MMEVLRFLALRAIPGLEEAGDGRYRRSLRLEHGAGVVELSADGCRLRLEDERDRAEARARCRRLLDLDADTAAIDAALGRDPLLAPLVRLRPGLRVPRSTDGFELAVRAIVGQQVTLAAARRIGARLVTLYGRPLEEPAGAITHLFPTPDALVKADSLELRMPRARAGALRSLAGAVLDGRLDLRPGADRAAATRALLDLPGVGPWTASYVGMRALGDSDAFPPGDAAVRRALERLGRDGSRAAAERLAERWRPWRSYALMHLWRSEADGSGPRPARASPSPSDGSPPR